MTREDLFVSVARGDRDAVAFLEAIFRIAHVWDDLVDLDEPVDPVDLDEAFRLALFDLPRNPFYVNHFGLLNPLLLSAINNWQVATVMERSGDEPDKRVAFITRSSYTDLITQVAFIKGGPDWVLEMGPTIRRFVHQEGWDQYLENLEIEKAARARRLAGE